MEYSVNLDVQLSNKKNAMAGSAGQTEGIPELIPDSYYASIPVI